MQTKRWLLAACLAAASASALADPDYLSLDMQLLHDGKLVGQPRLVTRFNEPAALAVDKQFRVELVGTDKGDSADLQLKLYLPKDGQLDLADSPRLLVRFDQPSTVEVRDAAGTGYALKVTPRKVAKPS